MDLALYRMTVNAGRGIDACALKIFIRSSPLRSVQYDRDNYRRIESINECEWTRTVALS